MKFDNRFFFVTREFAQDEFMSKAKKADESMEVFTARCWYNALLRTMNKEGYKLCIEKDLEKSYLQEQ